MRYTEIDGLRGVAALSVYFSHLIGVFVINSNEFDYISNSPFHILWDGESAVKLFFLLSGFVLTLPYIKNGNDLNLLLFYTKRVFRIYPAFVLAIIFCIFLQYFLFDSSKMMVLSPWINQFWKWDLNEIYYTEFINTIILAGIRFNHKLFDPVIGTLRTEILISFVLPFLIFIALRLRLIFNMLILFVLFFIGKDTMGIFYLGIIMAFFKKYIIDYVNKKDTVFYSILFFILASILYTSRYSLNFGDTSKLNVLLSVVGSAFFLILAMKKGTFNFFLNTRLVQFLGNISYSFYLLHFPVLMVVCSLFSNKMFFIFPISLLVTFFLSHLSFTYIELPFMRLCKTIKVGNLDLVLNKFFGSFIK